MKRSSAGISGTHLDTPLSNAVLLRVTNLCKSYAGVHALRGASFELRSGEVHALVGENGAGKSTLIRIITGAVEADSGQIDLDGKLVTRNSPRLARSMGIAAIYQQPALFPELSVAENLALGLEQSSLWTRINWSARRTRRGCAEFVQGSSPAPVAQRRYHLHNAPSR